MLDNIMFVILTYKAVSVDSLRWVILYVFSEKSMLPIIKNSCGKAQVLSMYTEGSFQTDTCVEVISDHGFTILATSGVVWGPTALAWSGCL